ncbi:serine/threonine-protein kinase unc-51-like protein, partial [Aphelenchoides avenae]
MTILHAHNIVHRDLKPGNLLLHNLTAKADLSEFDLTLKIADYGLARHLSKPEIQGEQLLKTVLGTLVYTAPELLKARIEKKPGEYTAKVDMWSIGMILYNCATGRLPFTEEDAEDGIAKVLARLDNLKFPPSTPDELRDLIKKLLQIDPSQRMGIYELASHPFCQDNKQGS